MVDALFALLGENLRVDAKPSSERAARLRRLVQTVPAPAFFHLFHLAVEEVWSALEHATPHDRVTPQVRQGIAETALGVFLRATRELRGAFRVERETAEPDREFDLDVFVKRLLDAEIETTDLEDAARRLGFDRQAEMTALAFQHLGNDSSGWQTLAARAAGILAPIGAGARPLGRYRDDVIVFLPPPFDDRALETAVTRAKAGCCVGIGMPATGVMGFRRTAREAIRALEIGRRLLNGLPEDKKALATLREFCRHGYNVKLTAAALGIHPHTLTYRLGGIAKRHGIDLGSPEGRFAAHIALLAIEVEGLVPPPRGAEPDKDA